MFKFIKIMCIFNHYINILVLEYLWLFWNFLRIRKLKKNFGLSLKNKKKIEISIAQLKIDKWLNGIENDDIC